MIDVNCLYFVVCYVVYYDGFRCVEYLDALSSLNTSLEDLPRDYQPTNVCSDPQIEGSIFLLKWGDVVRSMLDQKNDGDLNASHQLSAIYASFYSSRNEAALTMAQSTPMKTKGHVVLLLPVIYRLIAYAPENSIKIAAISLSDLINIQDIVTSYMDLLSSQGASTRAVISTTGTRAGSGSSTSTPSKVSAV